MLLQFANGELFATGAAPYAYQPATDVEMSPRVVVTITIGDFETSAFVDTGGVFLLCAPEIAEHLGLDPEAGVPVSRLLFRNRFLPGVLHRVPLTLRAEQGDSLTIETTASVPRLTSDQEWLDEFPCVLGMSGCLERVRFAVDPSTDTFFFGGLAESE